MANLLPILLVAGAAAVFLGKKKKKKRKRAATGYEVQSVSPTKAPAAAEKTAGPSGKAASSEVWKRRQVALAFVAGMKVCNSHPGAVDGVYGPATLNAIIVFQVCSGINITGKWGEQTEAAMRKMLEEISKGIVRIYSPKIRAIITNVEDDHEHDPHLGLSPESKSALESAIKSKRFQQIELYLNPGKVASKILHIEEIGLPLYEDHTHVVNLTGQQVERLAQGNEVFTESSGAIPTSAPFGAIGLDHTHFVKMKAITG